MQRASAACRQLLADLLEKGRLVCPSCGAEMLAWCAVTALGLERELGPFVDPGRTPCQRIYLVIHNFGEHDGPAALQPEHWFDPQAEN
jgi:hypothetical protein